MQKTVLTALLCSLCVVTHGAYADLLCVQRNVETKKGAVALSSAMRMATTKCPKGYVKLLDTETFRGDSGQAGEAGASYSNCVERSTTHQKVNLPTQRESAKFRATCSSGEFVHSFRMTTTYTYSSNWNFNSGDTDMAGQTYQAPTVTSATLLDENDSDLTILDENGFRSGFSFGVGGIYAHNIPSRNQAILQYYNFIGSVTAVADVKLLCCAIGE